MKAKKHIAFPTVLALFLVAYCKGSGDMKLSTGTNGIIATPGMTQVSAKISAENGGYISLQNMRLSIPAGALEQDTEIEAALTPVEAAASDGANKLGQGIKFSPEGLQFLKPIEVEFCYSATEISQKNLNEKSAMVYYAEDNGELVGMSGSVDEGRHCVTGHIEHFSVYIPAAQIWSVGNSLPAVGGANFLPAATTIMAGLPVRVRTTINDFNGGGVRGTIVSAFIMYCRTGDATCNLNPATATNKVPLLPDTTDGSVTNRYYATIPESFVTLAGFQYRFQASDNVGGVRTTAITTRSVTRVPTGLRFNPNAAMDISAGFVRDFTLQANDGTAWRNISADNFNVSGGIGTLARTGPSTVRFSALTKGAGTVNATSGALSTSVAVTVQTGLLTHIELMDNSQVIITGPINIGAGAAYTFDALGYDAYGNTIEIFPVFSTTGGVGTVSTLGNLTASAAAPVSGTVTATVGGIADTVIVNVFTQPTVLSTNPANGATGVSTGSSVSVTFSEPMATATLLTSTTTSCTGSIDISSDNFTTCVPMQSATPVFSIGDTVATIQPATPLTLGMAYRVRVGTAVTSLNNIAISAVYFPVPGFTVVSPVSGTLDSSFDGDGTVTTNVGGVSSFANAVEVQPDGKVIAAGRAYNGTNDFALVRYNVDGSLDATFGVGGQITTDTDGTHEEGRAICLQPDGKIVVTGVNGNGYRAAVIRYNSDGTLDPTFGSGGVVTTTIGLSLVPNAIGIQSDGKLVVVGDTMVTAGQTLSALLRYNANGSLDASFGSGGIVMTAIGGSQSLAKALVIQNDSKIVVAGQSFSNGPSIFAVSRHNPDGSFDSSFGTGGVVTTTIGSILDAATSLVVQVDGKIVVAGHSHNGVDVDFAVIRYNSDGSLDSAFGTGGIVTTNIGTHDQARALRIQSDGKIVLAGDAIIPGLGVNFAIARYNINGSLDFSFDSDGLVTTPVSGSGSQAFAVVVQSDGRIIAAGYSAPGAVNMFTLARYWP